MRNRNGRVYLETSAIVSMVAMLGIWKPDA